MCTIEGALILILTRKRCQKLRNLDLELILNLKTNEGRIIPGWLWKGEVNFKPKVMIVNG